MGRRTWLGLLFVCATLVPVSAPAATLAECSRSTPVLSPGSSWPWRPIASCVVDFTTTQAGPVVTKIDPDDPFTGTIGLRVRGVNALWTEYEGTFVAGALVGGVDTRSFTLAAGTWKLEVYLGGPKLPDPVPLGFAAFGTYRGIVTSP